MAKLDRSWGDIQPNCLFYGYFRTSDEYRYLGGDQCALLEPGFICLSLYKEQTPNWARCLINRLRPGLLEKLRGEVVFQRELSVGEEGSPIGINLRDWANYLNGAPLKLNAKI